MSGINLIDALVVAAYLGVVLYLGKRAASHSKSEEGYFLAGRKLGKLYQFFLNFGNATDANGAVSTATLVYQQGASGAWQAFQTVFMNPYYWFMNVWFRRVRLVTVAELFDERLSSRNLAKLYAFYQVLYIVFFIGWANLIGYNVTASLLPKPEASYTVEERQQVAQFREFHRLQKTDAAAMTPQERGDFEKLSDLYVAKRLHASISYVQPWQFYLGFTVIVGCYLFMGGMTGSDTYYFGLVAVDGAGNQSAAVTGAGADGASARACVGSWRRSDHRIKNPASAAPAASAHAR